MKITYDPKKNEKNIAKHGISFDRAAEFDLANAPIAVDDRKDYGETRLRAFGRLDGRMPALVYTEIAENAIRVIGFRRANKREVRRYGR